MLTILKKQDLVYKNIEPSYINENGETVWNIPTGMSELKEALIDTIKWQAGHNLKATDWAVTKCMELEIKLSEKYPEIAEHRTSIRSWSNEKELEVESCNTLDELISLDIKYV